MPSAWRGDEEEDEGASAGAVASWGLPPRGDNITYSAVAGRARPRRLGFLTVSR